MSYAYIENLTKKNMPLDRLLLPIERASVELARLDERLIRSGEIGSGFISRGHYLETCANIWMDGELVHLKDLVLHDVEADVRPPTHELTRAAHLLYLRRKLFKIDSKWNIDRAGLFKLINKSDYQNDEFEDLILENNTKPVSATNHGFEEAQKDEALYKEIDDITKRSQSIVEQIKAGKKITPRKSKSKQEKSALSDFNYQGDTDPISQWLELCELTKSYPATLAVAILLDAWLFLKPIENSNAIGRLICTYLMRQRLTHHLLPPLIMGLQKSKLRWQHFDTFEKRINVLLSGFETAANEAMAELDRLSLARERMMLSAKNCRSNSRLPNLINMFIEYPLISTSFAAKHLGVTTRAVDQLLNQLGPSAPRERTGRGRYRMWGIL